MTVQISSYCPRQQSQILELLGNSDMRSALWEWQFEKNPQSGSFNPVVATDSHGTVVGFNGVMPVRVRFDGEERLACWSCDFHVVEKHRGAGVGRLVKESLHDRHPLLMTLGTSPIAAKVLQRMGWHQYDAVRSYRRVTTIARPRDSMLVALQKMNWIRLRTWRRTHTDNETAVVELADTLPLAEAIDRLWGRVGKSYACVVCRDYAYLSWRYEKCPVTTYKYLVIQEKAELRAIAVYRESGGYSHFVDMVVDADDVSARFLLVKKWLESSAAVQQFQAVTSDQALGFVLEAVEFHQTRSRPRFFVHAKEYENDANSSWFIMSGDSDGEFLRAGRESQALLPDTLRSSRVDVPAGFVGQELRACQLQEDSVFADQHAWDGLIAKSDADPLFSSWAWLSAWWETWSQPLGLKACIIGVYQGERLVGLAPLFFYRRKWLKKHITELHFIGNAWKIAPTVRTEYVDIIAEVGLKSQVINAVETFLMEALTWDLVTVCDHMPRRPFPGFQKSKELSTILRKSDVGVSVDTSGSFDSWLASLGPNTRLKVFNRRNHIKKKSTITLMQERDLDKAFRELNRYHVRRWGKPCFGEQSLSFHRRFLERRHPDRELLFTSLRIDGVVQSLLYDVRVGKRVYNLQAGFEEKYDRKVTLGSLHLGYAIEAAFSNESIEAYDLLAGEGKNTFYKRSFHGNEKTFETSQLVRNSLLRVVYRVYNELPDSVRQPLLRLFRN